MEKGSASFDRPERIELPYSDDVIATSVRDPETSRRLLETDAVIWLRGAIGLDTERGASEISDRELLHRYNQGGRFEWDPFVTKAVRFHLKSLGFYIPS